jgi:hypothetical protein
MGHLADDSKKGKNISSVRAYFMVEIPAREDWLYKNKTVFYKIQKGLMQKGKVTRGSFAKYVEE